MATGWDSELLTMVAPRLGGIFGDEIFIFGQPAVADDRRKIDQELTNEDFVTFPPSLMGYNQR
jgi:hypothetical protein